jgi:hypothetical protein
LARSRAARGQPQRAARLFGAAAALLDALGAVLDPVDRAEYDRGVSAVSASLGQHAFGAARAAGRLLSLERAIAEALAANELVEHPGGSAS